MSDEGAENKAAVSIDFRINHHDFGFVFAEWLTRRFDEIESQQIQIVKLVMSFHRRLLKLEGHPHSEGLTKAEEREVAQLLTALVKKLSKTGLKPGHDALEGSKSMAQNVQDFRDLLAAADAETNRIADRIAELMATVHSGLTDAEADEIKAGLTAEVEKLRGVGVVTP